MRRLPFRGRQNFLVLMARQPVAGAVKTRLARDIGAVPAVWWYRHNIRRVIRRLRRDPRWVLVISACPDRAVAKPFWYAGVRAVPQGRGDLGERLVRILSGMPPGPVLVIGPDIPGVTSREIARAFRALRAAEIVLGPAGDGGYWAIGHRAMPRRLPPGALAGVRWSTEHALQDTRLALGAVVGRVDLVDKLYDVDRVEDLHLQAKAV